MSFLLPENVCAFSDKLSRVENWRVCVRPNTSAGRVNKLSKKARKNSERIYSVTSFLMLCTYSFDHGTTFAWFTAASTSRRMKNAECVRTHIAAARVQIVRLVSFTWFAMQNCCSRHFVRRLYSHYLWASSQTSVYGIIGAHMDGCPIVMIEQTAESNPFTVSCRTCICLAGWV
jgi:hypothetical protein